MKEILIDPMTTEALPRAIDFVEKEMLEAGFPIKAVRQVDVAVEEIFMNIALYAYHPGVGEARIRCAAEVEPLRVTIQFLDRGKPYNPLEHEPPDTSLPPEERHVGGLGILMARKSMSHMAYEYKDGLNILTLRKDA